MNLNLFSRHPIVATCSPKEASKLQEVSPIHESCVNLCRNDKLYQYYLLLCPYRLFVKTAQTDKKPVSFVPVEFCRLVTRFGMVLNSQVVHMISLKSDKVETNIFFDKQEAAEKWARALRPYTVSVSFEEEFIVQDKLGTGNFSSVYRCKEKTSGLSFAAKRFPKDRLRSDELELESLKNEVRLLGSTDHPNCIKLLGVFETSDYLFVLSNLFTGSDLLCRVLLEDRLQVLTALKICHQLIKILAHLESRQIIHRDVKPMNLLFKDTSEDSEICLVDFGFSTAICDSKKLFYQCGTAGYVAPEVLKGEDYDCRADVYSAGVVLHFMVTGEVPSSPFSLPQFVKKYQDILFPPLISSSFGFELRRSSLA
jgi:calcium-dependent protein kinase